MRGGEGVADVVVRPRSRRPSKIESAVGAQSAQKDQTDKHIIKSHGDETPGPREKIRRLSPQRHGWDRNANILFESLVTCGPPLDQIVSLARTDEEVDHNFANHEAAVDFANSPPPARRRLGAAKPGTFC